MFSHAYFTMTVQQLFSDNRNRPVSNLPPRSVGSAASRILTMLDGSHYDVEATEHERRMLRLWIDVGAPYPGTYAALGTGSIGGYAENQLVNTDTDWPTTLAGAEAIQRRCADCHQGEMVLPRVDERRARRVVLAVRASTTRGCGSAGTSSSISRSPSIRCCCSPR
jgi:hypothetical protein